MLTAKPDDKPPSTSFTPRGQQVMLPHGGLPEIISPYLLKLIAQTGGEKGPIGLQFIAQPKKEKSKLAKGVFDPLSEDHHEVAPGLVYKYKGRALWTITQFCGSYCRFCTRGREVGTKFSFLDPNPVIAYLKSHSEIKEIILSGGDPFTTPQSYLTLIITALAKLQKSGQLDFIRIGTRLPIHNPEAIKIWHYELVGKLKNPYLMIHINHPEELTPKTIEVFNNFRRAGATVMSQTVLLKGVNDSVETLISLFNKLAKEGIRPYYLYQNDPVSWAQHFTVSIKKAIKIWEQLRPQLSGIAATVRFVIDTPFGFGKIPIPEGKAWKVDYSHYFDFNGDKKFLK